ncbi:MAG: response regulator transcription factor [Anaerolineae bacterium]|nr:response regulator transcription factor [Anaerolineae bacterium]
MGEKTPHKVLIVDDHPMVRIGLIAALQSNPLIRIVGEASNGREALEMIRLVQPTVVLLDLIMPELDGLAAVKAIHQIDPSVTILIVTSYTAPHLINKALRVGAAGYISKNVTGAQIVDMIERVTAPPIEALIQPRATRSADLERPSLGRQILTPREQDVFDLLVLGWSNPRIADALQISVCTVKIHVSHILSKLGANSRREIIRQTMIGTQIA